MSLPRTGMQMQMANPIGQQQQNTTLSTNPQLSLTPGTPVNPQASASNLQQKEFNILSLCRIGQETVQDIVSRLQEVFGILKTIQPPNANGAAGIAINTADKNKAKIQEQFRTIRLLFKRLRILYDKCNDFSLQGMEYTHIESLIPLVEDTDQKIPEPVQTEEYKKALIENRELNEILAMKNRQLREIIDKIRIIVWEINTMISTRRSLFNNFNY